MKKIPSVILESLLPNLNSDKIINLLRTRLCADGCSNDTDGNSIGCHECIVQGDNPAALKEFRELLTKNGIVLNIVRSV